MVRGNEAKDRIGKLMTARDFYNIDAKRRSGECDSIKENESVMQADFGLPYICGRRGGDTYLEVQRATDDGKCPSGTEPCSTKTSALNTICYPEEKLSTHCPVTDIQIVTDSNAAKYDNYKKLDFNGRKLVYTNTGVDNRPITSTRVEYKPCIFPDVWSEDPD